MSSLVVTGSVGLDNTSTPFGKAENVLGGSATYFAAAASFFTPVRLLAAVGEDFSDEHVNVFKEFNIETTGLERRKGSKTFRWTGEYTPDMNDRNTLEVQPNILEEPLPPIPESYKDSEYLFLANTHPAAQLEMLDGFPRARLVAADTMDLWIETALPQLKQLLGRIHGLVLNDAEARQLTGKTNLLEAAAAIREMGPSFVVVKKGEHGCLLHHDEGVGVLHAYPSLNVVDPTGAGDCFGAGLMGYLAEVGDHSLRAIRRGLAYGTIVASFNIESFSLNRLREISRDEVDQRLGEYADIVRFD